MASPRDKDFTVHQAQDLARHFLGLWWTALLYSDGTCVLTGMASPPGIYVEAANWRTAFRKAGVKLPFRKRYVNIGPRVLLDDEQVAVCKSNTFAQRTAAALNDYEQALVGT